MDSVLWRKMSLISLFVVLFSCSNTQTIVNLEPRSKSVTLESQQKSSENRNIGGISSDVIKINDCKSSKGIILEFCQIGIIVDCVRKERGEYCTQYKSDSNGRMWGPF